MRPVDMMIMLHYMVIAEEMDEIRRSVPAYVDGALALERHGMIELRPKEPEDSQRGYQPASYRLTDKGRFWMEHVLGTPLPVVTWSIP